MAAANKGKLAMGAGQKKITPMTKTAPQKAAPKTAPKVATPKATESKSSFSFFGFGKPKDTGASTAASKVVSKTPPKTAPAVKVRPVSAKAAPKVAAKDA